MKYNLSIPKKIPSDYFWYFYRCMHYIQKEGIANIEYFDNFIKEQYVMPFYFNKKEIWIDVRDDNRLSETYKNCSKDTIILKSNFSSELWNGAHKRLDPEHQFKDWEYKLKGQLRPYILGRTLNLPYDIDEFTYFKPKNKIQYDLVSVTGNGITNKTTENRLATYEFLNENIFNTCLVFWLRNHGNPNQPILPEIKERALKFPQRQQTSTQEYYEFLASGKFILNIPGITLSQPFRCIDAVLSGRCVLSTKIWQDIYQSFPSIIIPIDTYFNEGDWLNAKNMLQMMDKIDYDKMYKESTWWYSWYLSGLGMWNNQLVQQIEKSSNGYNY